MTDKIFRVDWYPHNAYADYLKLEAEEIAVITQIINLIYINQGPIENDPKWICRSVSGMGSAKCRNIINKLIHNGDLYEPEPGKISKKMCENQLKTVTKRRENAEKNGRFGGISKAENQQNQLFGSSNSTSTNTSTSTSTNKHPNTQSNKLREEQSARGDREGGVSISGNGFGGGVSRETRSFNVENLLTEDGIELARQKAPGWDIYALMRTYSEGVNNGNREAPKLPDRAFPAWCAKYTKGKKP